jgi:hypothetical protein
MPMPLQVGIVAKLVNILFCCLWGGEGVVVGMNRTKRKKGKKEEE